MVNNTNSFANVPTSKTNVYLLGSSQMQVDKVALYLGRSYANDEDWFCMGKIIINGKEVFKCDKSSYAPELLEDDYITSLAIDYAFSRRAEQLIHEYHEMEKAIKKLSLIDSIFRKKEVAELRKKFDKLQTEYVKVKTLRENEALLKLVREHKTSPAVGSGGKRPPQPGEE